MIVPVTQKAQLLACNLIIVEAHIENKSGLGCAVSTGRFELIDGEFQTN